MQCLCIISQPPPASRNADQKYFFSILAWKISQRYRKRSEKTFLGVWFLKFYFFWAPGRKKCSFFIIFHHFFELEEKTSGTNWSETRRCWQLLSTLLQSRHYELFPFKNSGKKSEKKSSNFPPPRRRAAAARPAAQPPRGSKFFFPQISKISTGNAFAMMEL